MSSAVGVVDGAAVDRADDRASDRADVVRELQDRIRGMQRRTLDTRALPTHPAIGDLLPGGAITAGGSYTVEGSTTLALSLLQGPSAAGAWCAIVGMPDLGVEAAAGLGLDLDRLAIVPHPGDQWLSVVSALIDVVSVVLVNPPLRDGRVRIGEQALGRLSSRLRQREAVLVSMSDWPRADARLSVTRSDWAGIGFGFGRLASRQVTVSSVSSAWAGRTRSRRLWLPGAGSGIEAVSAPVETGATSGTAACAPLSAAG